MKNKRGQITIFIIVAVVIVALAVLFYLLAPKIGISPQKESENPSGFIKTCVEEDLGEIIDLVSIQGGSLNPEHYFVFDNVKIQYLCYSGNYYNTCVVQYPLLEESVEEEIKKGIINKVDNCFNSLKQILESDGYGVTIRPGETDVELLPERVVLHLSHEMTLTKDDSKQYDQFDIVLNNNLYELIAIAKSIVSWETTFGDADPRLYMTYYSHIKVEKNLRQDGTNLYTITDRNTGDQFLLASRSVVYPPGY